MATADSTPMIEALGLTKIYGKFAAIQNVNFSVPRGQVCAFLGPNGAGKSTTMKILTGYLTPTSGSAKIAGIDVNIHRMTALQKLGYLPENGPLYPEMTRARNSNPASPTLSNAWRWKRSSRNPFANSPKATSNASAWRKSCSTNPTCS
jgi:ABC-2 type transport system ATP-binding protein